MSKRAIHLNGVVHWIIAHSNAHTRTHIDICRLEHYLHRSFFLCLSPHALSQRRRIFLPSYTVSTPTTSLTSFPPSHLYLFRIPFCQGYVLLGGLASGHGGVCHWVCKNLPQERLSQLSFLYEGRKSQLNHLCGVLSILVCYSNEDGDLLSTYVRYKERGTVLLNDCGAARVIVWLRRPHYIFETRHYTWSDGDVSEFWQGCGVWFLVIVQATVALLPPTNLSLLDFTILVAVFSYLYYTPPFSSHFFSTIQASNPLVMVQAYRLLAHEMYNLGTWTSVSACASLHL